MEDDTMTARFTDELIVELAAQWPWETHNATSPVAVEDVERTLELASGSAIAADVAKLINSRPSADPFAGL